VEFFEPHPDLSDKENRANLLAREKHWFNWLFSLPLDLRYNFASSATAAMAGQSHSEKPKTLMSEAK